MYYVYQMSLTNSEYKYRNTMIDSSAYFWPLYKSLDWLMVNGIRKGMNRPNSN